MLRDSQPLFSHALTTSAELLTLPHDQSDGYTMMVGSSKRARQRWERWKGSSQDLPSGSGAPVLRWSLSLWARGARLWMAQACSWPPEQRKDESLDGRLEWQSSDHNMHILMDIFRFRLRFFHCLSGQSTAYRADSTKHLRTICLCFSLGRFLGLSLFLKTCNLTERSSRQKTKKTLNKKQEKNSVQTGEGN